MTDGPVDVALGKPRVYIAGPMTNRPHFNRAEFDKAAELLRRDGWEVFNPVEWDIEQYGEILFDHNPKGDPVLATEAHGFNRRAALDADLHWICGEADAIYMLKGWQNSSGARAEYAVAQAIDLTIFSQEYYPIDVKLTTYYKEHLYG